MDINEAWKATCRAIFREELGGLEEFRNYLLFYQEPMINGKSALSGKTVLLSNGKQGQEERLVSYDEINWAKKYTPLNINEIKDLESIAAAIQDRILYAGNKVFGNSTAINECDNCFDSHFVQRSHNIEGSKYVAYSSYIREGSQSIFGSIYLLRSNNLVRVSWADSLSRCFEAHACGFSSDLFFCYNCNNCANVMFSFNIRSKRYVIGNLELPREKFISLQKKLLSESADFLRKNKKFQSIFDVNGPASIRSMKSGVTQRQAHNEIDVLAKADDGFENTCRIVFGKRIGKLKENERLLGLIAPIRSGKSAFGNRLDYTESFIFGRMPKGRMINAEEASELEKWQPCAEINESDTLSDVIEKIGKLALFRMEFSEGNNQNFAKTPLIYEGSSDIYNVMDATSAKNCAYDTMVLRSEHCYGCYRMLFSQFCIDSYHSAHITRCFEISDSNNCSDCYFCHNVENCHESMFCFNAKNLRYAVGNVEIGRERYLQIKKRVLDEIARKLEADKKLDMSIYNIGCKARK